MAEHGVEDQSYFPPLVISSSDDELPRPRAEKRLPEYVQDNIIVGDVLENGEDEEHRDEDDEIEEIEELEEVEEAEEIQNEEDEEYEEEIQEILEIEDDENVDDNNDDRRHSFIDKRFQEKVDGMKKSWGLADAIEDAKIDFGKHGLTEGDIEKKNDFHPLYDLYENVVKQLEFHYKSNPKNKALSEASWVKNMRNNLKDGCIAHCKGIWVGRETDKRDPTSTAPTHAVILALRYASPTGSFPGAIAGYLASLGLAHLMQVASAADAVFTGGSPSQAEEQIWVAIEALKARVKTVNHEMKASNEEMDEAIESLQERHTALKGKIGKLTATELDAREKKLMTKMKEYVKKECFLRSEIGPLQKAELPATTKTKAPKPAAKSQPPTKAKSQASKSSSTSRPPAKTTAQASKSSSDSQTTKPAVTEREPYAGNAFLYGRQTRARTLERQVPVVNPAQNTRDNFLPGKKRKVDDNEAKSNATKKPRLDE
jgi:hypothetical protein